MRKTKSDLVGVYRIISPTNKIYVGQSIDIHKRFKHYFRMDCCGQVLLHRSLKKYGVKNHKFEIVEICSINELNNKERYWQERYNCIGNNGLNCFIIKGNNKSGKLSDEYRKKLSDSAKGKIRDQEYRKNISISKMGRKNPMYGKPSHLRKIVLDIFTGVYYSSLRDASLYYNYDYKNLSRFLSGTRKNKTQLIYV